MRMSQEGRRRWGNSSRLAEKEREEKEGREEGQSSSLKCTD